MVLLVAEPTEVWIGPATAGRSSAQGRFPNAISTAKYNPWLFIPQCLVEQFYRTANVYFLAVAIVQIVTDLSPTNQYSTLVPLLVVILLSMAKEGIEDWRRHSADGKSNHAPVRVLRSGGWAVAERQDIRPGDIIEVRADEQFPADLVILATSAADGKALVDMSPLTGKEGLAVRSAIQLTRGLGNDAGRLSKLAAGVVMEAQSASLDQVGGHIHVWPDSVLPPPAAQLSTAVDVPWSTVTTGTGPVSLEAGKWTAAAAPGSPTAETGGPASSASAWVAERAAGFDQRTSTQVPVGGDDVEAERFGADGQAIESVGRHRVVLRGSELRGTSFLVGAAVFTGTSTKMSLCSGRARRKRGRVDGEVNQSIWLIFTLLFLITAGSVAFHSNWQRQNAGAVQYLAFLGETRGANDVSRAFVTILILYNNLVPISLYVTLEIVRWCQARRIESDPQLHSAAGDAPVARTSNLNEDLGEVDFVFVDKTGTLTDNKMECRAVVIGGIRFGSEGSSPATATSTQAVAAAAAGAGSSSVRVEAGAGQVSRTPDRATSPFGASPGDYASPAAVIAAAAAATGKPTTGKVPSTSPLTPGSAGAFPIPSVPVPPAVRSSSGPQASHSAMAWGDGKTDTASARGRRDSFGKRPDSEPALLAAAAAAGGVGAKQAATALAELAKQRLAAMKAALADCRSTSDAQLADPVGPSVAEHIDAAPFGDSRLLALLRAGVEAARLMRHDPASAAICQPTGLTAQALLFFYSITLCHSVTCPDTPTTSVDAAAAAAPSLPPWRLYRSTSPDERALLLAARAMGFGFAGRQGNRILLEVMGQVETWGVVNIHPFSSTRRVMSVVVRSPSGMVFVFAKGADSAMLPRLYNSDVARREAARAGPLPTVHSVEASTAAPSNSSDGIQPAYVDGFAGSDGILSPLPADDSFHVRSAQNPGLAAIDSRTRARLAASPALLPPALAAGSLLEGSPGFAADDKGRASARTGAQQSSLPTPPSASQAHAGLRSRTSSSPEGRGLLRPGSASSVYRPGSASAAADPLPSMGVNSTSEARVQLEGSIADLWETGLRTMVVAARQLTADEERAWRAATREAAATSGRRKAKLSQKAADMVEFGLVGLGVTGVQHNLQEGVPKTVETLRQSGCRVWMVTGDNEEPAISVAHAAGMIREASTIVALNGSNPTECEHQLATARAELRSKGRWHPRLVDDGLVCVINGEALSHILAASPRARRAEHEKNAQRQRRERVQAGGMPADIDEDSESSSDSDAEAEEVVVGAGASSSKLERAHGRIFGASSVGPDSLLWWLLHPGSWLPQWLTSALGISDSPLEAEPLPRERRLLELLKQCRTVLACSMTPAQKAQLVLTVKTMVSPGPVTVAIGDGTNDVAMIREAHVGIGVTGGECTHAVRTADFSVPSFSTLAPLMLTHGRQNKLRTSLTILYSFFKNVALVFTLLLFSNLSGYSGTSLYESYLGAGWNVAWTFFPILAIGIVDRDLSKESAMAYPVVYRQSFRGAAFSVRSLAWWVVQGVLYAGATTLAAYSLFGQSWLLSDGTTAGIWPTGAVINLILMALVSCKLVIHMNSWCFATLGSVLLSFLLWFAFVIVYSILYGVSGVSVFRDFSSVAMVILQQPLTWLGLLLFIGTAAVLEVATHHLMRQMWPTSLAIMQEWDKGLGDPQSSEVVAEAAEAHRRMAIAKQRKRALKQAGGGYMLLQQSKWHATEQQEAVWEVEAMGDSWRPKARKLRSSSKVRNNRHVIIGRLQGSVGSGLANLSVTGGKLLSMEEHLRQVASIEALTTKVHTSQQLLWRALRKRLARRKGRGRTSRRSLRAAAQRTAAVAPAAIVPVAVSSGPVPQAPQLRASGLAERSSEGMKLTSFHASDELANSHARKSSRHLNVPSFMARQRLAFAPPPGPRDVTSSRSSDRRRSSAIEQLDDHTRPSGSATASHRAGSAWRPHRRSVSLAPAWAAGSEGEVLSKASRAGGAKLRQQLRDMQHAKATGAEGLALSLEDSAAPRLTKFSRQFADDPELERAYHFRFFLGKSLPVTRTGLLTASALGGAFIIYEYFASVAGIGGFLRRTPEHALRTLLVRMVLVVGALLAVLFTFTSTFRRNHNSIMFVLLLITGIAKTVIVSDAGTFGQTLYTICVLLILRLSFASAAVLAVLDLAIFTAAVGANLVGDGVASLIDYIPYAGFVLAFGLSGALAIDDAMRQDFLQQARLAAEKKSFNDILKSSMPPHVTKKLKRMELGGFRGKYYDKEDEISVIFIDVIDFEKVTSSHTPQMMVTLLDRLWRLFDALVEKHLVTKMETVGKTYMACAGLQQSRTDHATALVMLGLDILRNLRAFKDVDGKRIISVKIGIHSGPVVSGVAGLKKQQFSLFGDTVNTSSRMQSSGEPNRIHVSPATYALVEGQFETEARRTPVKSKGIMTTHLIERVANSEAAKERRRASAIGLAPLLAGPSSQATGAAASAAATRAAARAVAEASPVAATARHVVAVSEAEPATRPASRMSRNSSKVSRSESPGQLAKRTPSRTSLPTGVQRAALADGKTPSTADLANPSSVHSDRVASPSAADSETPRDADGTVAVTTLPEAGERRREDRFSIVNYLYVFKDAKVENSYQVKRRRSQLVDMRTAGLVLGLFAIFRVLWDDRATERSRVLRVVCAVIMFMAAGLTASKLVRRIPPAVRHSMVAALFATAGCLLAAAQASSSQVTLDIVFFTSLCSASGAVHHLGALFANLVVVSFALGISATNSLDFARGDSLTGTASFFAGIGVVAGTLASATRAYYKRRRFGLEVLTREETKRAHGILYNMLPAALVNQIKEGKQGASDAFRNVTLLFCDIRGFTKMASSVSPEEVVDVLDKLFCSLDAITDQYQVFKVQTIGDAYVMVAGMPFKDQRVVPDSPAAAAEIEALPVPTARPRAGLVKTASKASTHSLTHGGGSMASIATSSLGTNPFGSSASLSSSEGTGGDAFVDRYLTEKCDAPEVFATASTGGHGAGRSAATNSAQLSTAGSQLLAPASGQPAQWGRSRLNADAKRGSKDISELDSSQREGNPSSKPSSSVDIFRQPSESTTLVSDWDDDERKVLDEAEAAGIEDPEYRAQHPKRRATAEAMVNVAMDMLQAIKKIKHPGTGEPLVMRIGLHTGDIVGGVIGSKTLRYDIWGTDVLVANKMESEGIPGGLVVSHDTRLALIGVDGLEFRAHKDVTAKGRGTIKTFQVIKTVTSLSGKEMRIGDVELDGDGHGGELDALRQQATQVVTIDTSPSDSLDGPSPMGPQHGSPQLKSPQSVLARAPSGT